MPSPAATEFIDPASARSEYLRKLQSHCANLRSACERQGMAYIQLATDRPLELALFEFLRARMQSRAAGPAGSTVCQPQTGMNFLAPLFLLGALAVALPVLFHLIRRSVKERTLFQLPDVPVAVPAEADAPEPARASAVAGPALRGAVPAGCGLCAALSEAGLPRKPAGGAGETSACAARYQRQHASPGLWSAARAKAEDIVRKAGPADQVALFTFDRQLKSLVSFDQWSETAAGDRLALARNRLADTKPGWASTALDSALTQAAELFGDRREGRVCGTKAGGGDLRFSGGQPPGCFAGLRMAKRHAGPSGTNCAAVGQ